MPTTYEVIETPESPMRFFTPELFLRVNSENEEAADAAHQEWEAVTDAYRHHLKKVLRSAPASVIDLAGMNFHDAVVNSFTFDPYGRRTFAYTPAGRIPPSVPRPAPVLMRLSLPARSIGLVYFTWDGVIRHAPVPGWTDHGRQRLWLYDEVDEIWSPFGMFIHRILLSNGEVWEIPFYDVLRVDAPDHDPAHYPYPFPFPFNQETE